MAKSTRYLSFFSMYTDRNGNKHYTVSIFDKLLGTTTNARDWLPSASESSPSKRSGDQDNSVWSCNPFADLVF